MDPKFLEVHVNDNKLVLNISDITSIDHVTKVDVSYAHIQISDGRTFTTDETYDDVTKTLGVTSVQVSSTPDQPATPEAAPKTSETAATGTGKKK